MMKLMAQLRIFLFIVLLFPLAGCSAPLWYQAEPIEAWVVDEETGKPLEGVVVVAHWQLKGGLEGGNPVGQMMLMETVTDKDGRFYFPGWGPKLAPLFGGELRQSSSPDLLVFKPGYLYQELGNNVSERAPRNPLRSDWDKKTIKLKRFDGSLERGELENPLQFIWNGKVINLPTSSIELEKYAENVYYLNSAVESIYTSPPSERKKCLWKKMPHMIVAIHNMSLYFEERGIKLEGWRGGRRIDKISDIYPIPDCGSVEGFFRGYLK